MLTLKGRTACVIGIGEPGVRELLEAGMNVAIFTHSPELTNSIIESCGEELTKDHLMVISDGYVDNDEIVIPALKQVYERFGSIDMITIFAGWAGRVKEIEDVTLDEINKDVPYLVATAFNFTKRALPYLKESRAGRVIYISTTEAQHGGLNSGFVDNLARGAMLSLTYNMAKRLSQYGITVNCISVGPFDKQMKAWNDTDKPNPYLLVDQVPMGRVGTPKDVAAAIHYLASEEAGFMTGQVLNLNGGYYMG